MPVPFQFHTVHNALLVLESSKSCMATAFNVDIEAHSARSPKA
jgi:hypothetical protein